MITGSSFLSIADIFASILNHHLTKFMVKNLIQPAHEHHFLEEKLSKKKSLNYVEVPPEFLHFLRTITFIVQMAKYLEKY